MQPETELLRLGFEFLAPAPSPASRLQTQRPTTTTTSSAPPYHLSPLISTPTPDGALKIVARGEKEDGAVSELASAEPRLL